MRTLIRVLLVACVAGLVVVVLSGASGEEPGKTLRTTLQGQPARLNLPTGEARGLAIWFHGQGGNVNDRVDGPFLSALRRDGWAVASSDFHNQSWGNAASTEDVKLLTEWAEKQVGMKVSLWVAGSMGGSVSLNALTHGVAAPKCWYGVKPAISLLDMGNVPTAEKNIAAAYGGPVPADRNPVYNVGQLPMEMKYRVVTSPEDTWVVMDQNAGALASKLDARGADITYLMAQGPHEDPSHWNAPDLLKFAADCTI